MARRKTTKENRPVAVTDEHPRHYIREWRIFRGMTQKDVADKMKFTNGALSQLETGRTAYRQDMLEALAKALECSPGDLLNIDPNTGPDFYNEYGRMTEKQKAVALKVMKAVVSADEATDQPGAIAESATMRRAARRKEIS